MEPEARQQIAAVRLLDDALWVADADGGRKRHVLGAGFDDPLDVGVMRQHCLAANEQGACEEKSNKSFHSYSPVQMLPALAAALM